MRFIDEAKIKIKAGDGGAGIVAWRREKFVPHGGPAGGDGGKGGDIIFIAKSGMSSLIDLKNQSIISSEEGERGQSKNKTGRNGRDKIVFVPVGTTIWENLESKKLLADLVKEGQRVKLCNGGDGGFGNAHFKSANCHAPEKATDGQKGEEREIVLTLKLMADIGLLGFPNAGKSTLLRRLSKAKPKVADYPFTTIKPTVGVCEVNPSQSMVIADIPGLIEGASNGLGLGFRFLRHLERVRVLCHIIDGSLEEDLVEKYLAINRELKSYSEELFTLPQIVAINKTDAISNNEHVNKLKKFLKNQNIKSIEISAVLGEGLKPLKSCLWEEVVKRAPEKDGLIIANNIFDPTKNLY